MKSQKRPHPSTSSPLVGIDVGGTFTDFVTLIDNRLQVYKIPTTPTDQSQAIVAGLADLEIEEAEIVHGMTVATNALLERDGAKTALLTTAGFQDILIIGRQNRPHIYKFSQQRPKPLVEEALRYEVPERVDHDGIVLTALDEQAVLEIGQMLKAEAVESVALVYLFSFRNPAHEQRTAELLRIANPDLPLSLSHEILPEYREYERTATTVINAYVQPLVARYMTRLETALGKSHVRIMQSNGGAIGLHQAAEQAARVVLSGPAGGVVGAFDIAKQATGGESPQIMTFDMGGTSTDVALCPGHIPTTSESTITALPLRLPVIDIHTVGAGGGSIASMDAGGGLRVGPRSAGAVPGPACYGRGGQEPTVTDANLVLGRLDPSGFLGGGGSVALDIDAAQAVFHTFGRQLGLSSEEAALGVIRVANATMERALRSVSVERGYDPRQFTLVPFGGAGPLHACALAESLGMQRILIPTMPGVLSAYGMLVADIVNDGSQSILHTAEVLLADPTPLQSAFDTVLARVSTVLAGEGVEKPDIATLLDMRYRGQSYELTVPLALSIRDHPATTQSITTQSITAQSVTEAVAAFHQAHAQRYGYAMQEAQVEVVTLRVRGSSPGARPTLAPSPLGQADPRDARLGGKAVWFNADGPTETTCYNRDLLQPGNEIVGPAIVFQFDTTIVVGPGWRAHVDGYQNLWLEQ